jgi:hypothetical protein
MNVQRLAKLLQNREQVIREVVLNKSKDNNLILYGARGFNAQVPGYLRKKTTDYDLLSKKPKRTAKEIAETLSRRLEGNVNVKKAKHKGTYKIQINGENIIDITQLKKKPKTKRIFGTEVKDIKSIKRNTQRLLKNPNTEYRREKDMDTFNRIMEIERIEQSINF